MRTLKNKLLLLLWVVTCTAVLWPASARADSINDLSFALQQTTIAGAPGSTISLFGTLTDVSPTDTISICDVFGSCDGYSLNVTSAPDDSPFLFNLGFTSLSPGASTGPQDFLDIALDPSAAAGLYTGNSFTVNWQDDLGDSYSTTDYFNVDVATPSAVPEPDTFLLLASGLLALALASRKRRPEPRPALI